MPAQLTDWHDTSARQAIELTEYFLAEYYGSQRAWSAYNSLHDAYEEAGWSEEQISNVLQIQTLNDEWFAQRGVTSNYHGGGNVVFGEYDVLNWVLSHTKEENES